MNLSGNATSMALVATDDEDLVVNSERDRKQVRPSWIIQQGLFRFVCFKTATAISQPWDYQCLGHLQGR